MPVLDEKVLKNIDDEINSKLFPLFIRKEHIKIERVLDDMISRLHISIEDKKRSSYGITYVVKTFSKHLFIKLDMSDLDVYDTAYDIYEKMTFFQTKCIGLGVISHFGIINRDKVLGVFRHAAGHEEWQVREFAQMYIRKITKKHPKEIQKFLIELANSQDANLRRFASEALRPVVENRWIIDNPEYSLTVLRNLFKESDPYPRLSVANNLSDLSRSLPKIIYEIIEELVSFEDENSYFIAYRACRNLVTKDTIKVLNLLNIDEYNYKNRHYKRSTYL